MSKQSPLDDSYDIKKKQWCSTRPNDHSCLVNNTSQVFSRTGHPDSIISLTSQALKLPAFPSPPSVSSHFMMCRMEDERENSPRYSSRSELVGILDEVLRMDKDEEDGCDYFPHLSWRHPQENDHPSQ